LLGFVSSCYLSEKGFTLCRTATVMHRQVVQRASRADPEISTEKIWELAKK
jgi:hypothetical protein